jgi:drug/metabolite transporter (DMT)-like permease
MTIAVFIFAVTDAGAKWVGLRGIHAGEIVFFRYLFGLIPVAIAIYLTGTGTLRTARPVLHVVRALFMCAALLLFFWGLAYVPLAEAIAIAFVAPIFITALSMPVLGEQVGPHRWGAVVIGFVGMMIILRPGLAAFRPEAMFIIGAAATFSCAVLMTRRMTASETNTAIFTYTTLVSLLAMMPLAAVTWQTPEPADILVMALIGLFGGAAHFLVIVAYRHAPAAVNATFEYMALIWGSLLGWFLWRERPDTATWIGAAIIIAAGLYITHRETRRKVPDTEIAARKPH